MPTAELERTTERTAKQHVGQGIIYLAAPYTDPDPQVRLWRYDMATIAAATLAAEGLIVFSPITMTHPMDVLLAESGETLGSDHWVAFDKAFMDVCSEMRILTLDGWDSSSGIKCEMEFFKTRGRSITLMTPRNMAAV